MTIIKCPKCNEPRSNEVGSCLKCGHDLSVVEMSVSENQREVIQAAFAAKDIQVEAREAQLDIKRQIFVAKQKIEESLFELCDLLSVVVDEKYDLIEKQSRLIIDKISQIPH